MSNLLAEDRRASLAAALAHRPSLHRPFELADRLSLRLALWLAWQSARRLEHRADRQKNDRLLRNEREREHREHAWQRSLLHPPR